MLYLYYTVIKFKKRNMSKKPLVTIGRAEFIELTGLCDQRVPAKVDTGADLSSVWATDIRVEGSELVFKLFDSTSPFFNGKDIRLPRGEYRLTRIANSFGEKEIRYAVKMSVVLAGKKVRATFSLSNRANKLYPVLIGRKLLNKKYVVDVSLGEPLHEQEKSRKAALLKVLEEYEQVAEGEE